MVPMLLSLHFPDIYVVFFRTPPYICSWRNGLTEPNSVHSPVRKPAGHARGCFVLRRFHKRVLFIARAILPMLLTALMIFESASGTFSAISAIVIAFCEAIGQAEMRNGMSIPLRTTPIGFAPNR